MDKFINTSNGGIPLVNDDFRWSDESIRDFIDNHLSDFAVTIGGNGNFYLSGVNISYSAPDYTITEGYVYINGEIVKVDAQTCSPSSLLAGEEFRFEVVETFDATGNKTTRNGSSIFTYKKRRAVPTIVTSTDPLTDSQLVFEVTASQERLQEKIDKLLGDVSYTEQNYITDGEKITDSIDALDVQLKDVSDKTDKIGSSSFSDTIIDVTPSTTESDIVSTTATATAKATIIFSCQFHHQLSGSNTTLTYKFYVDGSEVYSVKETCFADDRYSISSFTIQNAVTAGDTIKVTSTMGANTCTIEKATLTVILVD